MNPFMSFPTELESRRHRRMHRREVSGFPPAGEFSPFSIPNLLLHFDMSTGMTRNIPQVSSRGTAISNWNSATRGDVLSGTTQVIYALSSRMDRTAECVFTATSGTFTTGALHYLSRPLSCFAFVRRRKVWSADTEEGPIGTYFCRFTGATDVDYYLGYSTAGGNSYKFHILDNASFSGNYSLESMITANTFDLIGFTISPAGRVTFYENNRAVSTTGSVAFSRKTGFQLGRSSGAVIYLEMLGLSVWQQEATAEQVKQLGRYYRRQLSRGPIDGPTASLTLTGDSITAGETYVSSNQRTLPTICERIWQRMPHLRIGDVTRSSTFIADGVTWMLQDGTSGQAGGNAIHSSYFGKQVHVIAHGRNDVGIGTSVANSLTALQTAISQQTALGRMVFPCTIIATVYSVGAWPSQDDFDQACIDYNQAIRDNYVSWGCTGYIDFASHAGFAPVVGQTPYTDTAYYAGDNIHPNGTRGADTLTQIIVDKLSQFV